MIAMKETYALLAKRAALAAEIEGATGCGEYAADLAAMAAEYPEPCEPAGWESALAYTGGDRPSALRAAFSRWLDAAIARDEVDLRGRPPQPNDAQLARLYGLLRARARVR